MVFSKIFKALGWGSYYGKIGEAGLEISDIFGKKIIKWNDIVSVYTHYINEEHWGYVINTPENYFQVIPTGENFENLLVTNASLEPYGIHKFDPQHFKRWKKSGLEYKTAGYIGDLGGLNFTEP